MISGSSKEAMDLVSWFVRDYTKATWQANLPSRQIDAARELLKAGTARQVKNAIRAITEGRMPSLGFEPRAVTSLSYLLEQVPDPTSGGTRTLFDEYLSRERVVLHRRRPEVAEARSAYEGTWFQGAGYGEGV